MLNSGIVNQFMFKINEAKLRQDLKIVDLVKSDFNNYVHTLEMSLENQMLYSCKKYNQVEDKVHYDTCMKENAKKVEVFKEFSKNYKKRFADESDCCKEKLKMMGFKPADRQAFHTIVDLEDSSAKKSELLQEEAFRTKANQWKK